MAINFPSSPSDGQVYLDPGSGTEWVYNSTDNSWTINGAGSSSPFQFRGGYDFTTNNTIGSVDAGDLFIHEGADGTVGSGYTGLSGQITTGTLVLWDGNEYVKLSSAVPDYPDTSDDNYQNGTLDDRYLNLAANAGDQLVQSNGLTEFTGTTEHQGGVRVTGGNVNNVVTGMHYAKSTERLTTAVEGNNIASLDNDYVIRLFNPDGTAVSVGKVNKDILTRFGIHRGNNTRFEMTASGGFIYKSENPNQSYDEKFNVGATFDGDTDPTIKTLRNSIALAKDNTITYSMIAKDTTSDSDIDTTVNGINFNIGAANTLPVKFGIGETNNQTSNDYVKIAGVFPDKDPTDISYDQSIQNMVSLRGSFNTRLATRGVGLLINALNGPENATQDIAQIEGVRIATIRPGDAPADNDVTIGEIDCFNVNSGTGGYFNNNYPDVVKPGAEIIAGIRLNLATSNNTARVHYNLYAIGGAPNYISSSTYIGGNTSRSTFELWKSTLTEEQLEQLEAGTLVAPANVSLPGDGSFARQWWYDQQSTEDQALIDSGELDYPKHLLAANFTDTFALGDNTRMDLLSNGRIAFKSSNFGNAIDSTPGAEYPPVGTTMIAQQQTGLGIACAGYNVARFCSSGHAFPFEGAVGNTFANHITALGTIGQGFVDKALSGAKSIDIFSMRPDLDAAVDYTGTSISFVNAQTPNGGYTASNEFNRVYGFNCQNIMDAVDGGLKIGYRSNITTAAGKDNYNFYANGDAPSFLKGNTYIGGNTSRNTFDLWQSTLTEGQLEQLTVGTLAAPANVSTPGDGSFARQWYYNQQDAETQAELAAGTLDYPEHLQAAKFTDNFVLGDNTVIDLKTTGVVSLAGLGFDKGSTNLGGINYSGFYKSAGTGYPRLVQHSDSTGVDVICLDIIPYAYDPKNDSNVNISTATALKISSPNVSAGSDANAVVTENYGLNVGNIGVNKLAVGGRSYAVYTNQANLTDREAYNFYAASAAPNFFEGVVEAKGGLKVSDASNGLILTSPNGSEWRLTVDDSGVLTTAAV